MKNRIVVSLAHQSVLILAATLLLAAPLARAQVVTTTASSGSGSLRAVVAAAAPGATITFAAGLSGQTISLGSSQILLNKNVTIDASALPLGIQITQPAPGGNVPFARMFQVATNTTVSLKALTMWGGSSDADVNSDPGYGIGGAIFIYGGTLTLTDCLFYNNRGPLGGGAILNLGGTLTLNQCTLTGNYSDGGNGGAISSDGSLTINQSTITGNSAEYYGGGVYAVEPRSFALFNSILAGNTALGGYPNFFGAYTAKGTNLIGGDPLLLPLGHYGGPTQTMPPRTHSPALDAASDLTDVILPGNTNFVPTTFLFPTDQRGRPRLFGPHVDIGAVELQSPMVVTNLADAGPGSLRQAVGEVDPADNTITFAAGLSGQSIQLDSTLVLGKSLAIDASALPAGIRILGAGRVMEVTSGQTVLLRSLEVRNGYHNDAGAGIYNAGTLTLDRCTLANNGSNAEGSYRPLTGGALYNVGVLTLNQCTVAGNVANSGAAIYSPGGATLTINQSTIAGNEGNFGTGGIYHQGALTLNNTILAGNLSSGFSPNLSGGGTLTPLGTNLTTGDPLLAALGNYGGPTQTMPPLPGSPALDAGADSATNSFTTDQRGGWRRSGAGVDIGAVEVMAASGVPAELTGLTRLADGARQFSFTNLVAAGFTVYASTNVAAPFNTWSNLGPATESPLGSGQYQFTDPAATNNPQRFYRVQSP